LKYDNGNNFSKESSIGGDIIDSNVTEGLTSLPPVESRVTAYHAKSKVMACTPCVQPTVPAGTTLGREAPFLKYNNDNNVSKESRTGGDIIDSNITEGLMSLPPVESRVTAYHAKSKVTACSIMRATRSARNNIREGGAILEVRQQRQFF
jgi:hypothetical protein